MNLKSQIEKLETDGFEVEIQHLRFPYDDKGKIGPCLMTTQEAKKDDFDLCPIGGRTVALISTKDGIVTASGTAHCSFEDNYNRKLGATIALGRAVCEMSGEKKRREIRTKEREKELENV
jgi:hypothetical protein